MMDAVCVRATVLVVALLTSTAQAQTLAIPDGGGGYLLHTPNGIGTATPDGGYQLRLPDAPYRPAPRLAPSSSPIEPSGRSAASLGDWGGGSLPEPARAFRCSYADGAGYSVTLDPQTGIAHARHDFNPDLTETYRVTATPAIYQLNRTNNGLQFRLVIDLVTGQAHWPLVEPRYRIASTCRLVNPF